MVSIATAAAAAEVQASRAVEITGTLQQQQFAVGETVKITADVADDIYAFGREVTLDGAKARSLIVATGHLVIRNSTVHELMAGSLDVEINGQVEDDATIAVCPVCPWGTRRILIGKDGRIGDQARLVAETIEIEGNIGGTLQATARRIVISGSVTGQADLTAEQIVFAPTARLGGELIARSPGKPEIATGAVITGPIREIPTKVDFPDPAKFPRQLAWVAGLVALAATAGMLLLAALVQFAVPRLVQSGVDRLVAHPWTEVGLGLAWALLTPALVALLLVTVVGAPAGLVLLAGFVVLAATGFVTACYAIGLWLRGRMRPQATAPGTGSRIGWTLIGVVILILINVVPFLGWIIGLLATMAGLGAAASALSERLRAAPAT